MAKTDGLISTAAAAELLGLSVSQFTRIMTARGIKPDDWYTNPHYKSGPPAKLWNRRKIAKMKGRKYITAALARKGGAAPRDYASEFAKRYDSPRTALADACEALFNLNRYTRHRTCSDANRREIFDLKSALIEKLYKAERYTDRVECLTKTLPAQECNRCYGVGCERCEYTGEWRSARDVASYAFTFTVNDRRYSWIQPDHALTFTPTVEETREDDGTRGEREPELNIPRSKLAEAKALVRFALAADD